ncbi:hypothetical protein NHX12_021880 [Muraenolepis orangiensis]|uniref:EGF-like domain-containing protein n=1 Tax=Muraenolepis orangiensis TaxID=630683 RepID=A0A9Q0EWK6_9TELE|nr:hypothetical protein NHX12_021880 [Muraenolepis orangiensis]
MSANADKPHGTTFDLFNRERLECMNTELNRSAQGQPGLRRPPPSWSPSWATDQPVQARVCDQELLRCQNGGVCHDHQRCQCTGGFSGLLCEKHRCEGELGPGCDGAAGGDSGQAPLSAPGLLPVLMLTAATAMMMMMTEA